MGARRPSAVIIHKSHVPQEAKGQVDMRGVLIFAITVGAISFFWIAEFMPKEGDAVTEDTPYRLAVEDRPRGAKATKEPPKPLLLTLENCVQVVNEALKEYVERHAEDRAESHSYGHEEERSSKTNAPAKASYRDEVEESERSDDAEPAEEAKGRRQPEADEDEARRTAAAGESDEVKARPAAKVAKRSTGGKKAKKAAGCP